MRFSSCESQAIAELLQMHGSIIIRLLSNNLRCYVYSTCLQVLYFNLRYIPYIPSTVQYKPMNTVWGLSLPKLSSQVILAKPHETYAVVYLPTL